MINPVEAVLVNKQRAASIEAFCMQCREYPDCMAENTLEEYGSNLLCEKAVRYLCYIIERENLQLLTAIKHVCGSVNNVPQALENVLKIIGKEMSK